VELINRGKIKLDEIITHSFPVDRLEEAIHMQMSDQSIKVMIEP
jgi:threonine dehydrogenase-like Zn-dependent dehydrogenase